MLRLPVALLLALQVVGPFESSVGPFESSVGPFESSVGPFDPGARPWLLDLSENVVRRVHRGAFDGRTAIWVRLLAKADDGVPPASSFLFVAEFAGKSPRARPPVTWQVDTNVQVYTLVQRVARLHVAIDGGRPIDLLAPGEQWSVGYCCDDAAVPASATVALSAERLDRLAAAATVSGDAFGVRFTLDAAQLRALAQFRTEILPPSR